MSQDLFPWLSLNYPGKHDLCGWGRPRAHRTIDWEYSPIRIHQTPNEAAVGILSLWAGLRIRAIMLLSQWCTVDLWYALYGRQRRFLLL